MAELLVKYNLRTLDNPMRDEKEVFKPGYIGHIQDNGLPWGTDISKTEYINRFGTSVGFQQECVIIKLLEAPKEKLSFLLEPQTENNLGEPQFEFDLNIGPIPKIMRPRRWAIDLLSLSPAAQQECSNFGETIVSVTELNASIYRVRNSARDHPGIIL